MKSFLLAAFLCLPAPAALAQTQAAPARGAFEVTSLLGQKLYALPDDDAVIAARKKLVANPKDPALYVALSQAEAGRRQYQEAVATCSKGLAIAPDSADLYIERGHREVGLREFARAQRDLEHATTLDPKKLDAFYHLGLAHYFQGQFDAAAEAFQKALALAQNDDSVIDCSNWVYASLRRAGKDTEAVQALKRITPEMKNKEPHLFFYLQLLRYYQGAKTATDIRPPKPTNPNDVEGELSFDTVSYGLANMRLITAERAYEGHATPQQLKGATNIFKEIVTGNAWNAWGFVGSEVELARMAEKGAAGKNAK